MSAFNAARRTAPRPGAGSSGTPAQAAWADLHAWARQQEELDAREAQEQPGQEGEVGAERLFERTVQEARERLTQAGADDATHMAAPVSPYPTEQAEASVSPTESYHAEEGHTAMEATEQGHVAGERARQPFSRKTRAQPEEELPDCDRQPHKSMATEEDDEEVRISSSEDGF